MLTSYVLQINKPENNVIFLIQPKLNSKRARGDVQPIGKYFRFYETKYTQLRSSVRTLFVHSRFLQPCIICALHSYKRWQCEQQLDSLQESEFRMIECAFFERCSLNSNICGPELCNACFNISCS